MAKKSTPPPVPDYAAAAQQQGAANLEAAIATSRLGNPNIYGPLGSQTVSYGTTKKYDQAGYDQALIDYKAMSEDQKKAEGFPTKKQFTTDDFTTPTIQQNLTPNAQATLEAQQEVEKQLAGLGLRGISTADKVLSTPFDPKLPGITTDISGKVSPVNQSVYNSEQAQRNVAGPTAAGTAQGSVTGPTLQQGINTAGIAAMPVNAGMTGQQAIMSRLQPQLTQNENAARQRLANQGLVAGGEAYQNEMRTMGQNRNDLELQAAAQGINLDAMMNQQGFQQAQAQGQFGNEAQLAQFNAAMQNTGLGNQAIQQNYENQLSQFGAGLQNAGLNNAAIQQNYQNQLASQTAQNAAIAQNYNQQLGLAQFGNEAQGQSLSQQLAIRNQPLNEISGLMSGSQIQMPQFQGYQGANIAAAPVYQGVQDTFQGQMDQYGIRQAAKNATTQGLMSLGGSLGGAGMGMMA